MEPITLEALLIFKADLSLVGLVEFHCALTPSIYQDDDRKASPSNASDADLHVASLNNKELGFPRQSLALHKNLPKKIIHNAALHELNRVVLILLQGLYHTEFGSTGYLQRSTTPAQTVATFYYSCSDSCPRGRPFWPRQLSLWPFWVLLCIEKVLRSQVVVDHGDNLPLAHNGACLTRRLILSLQVL